MISKKSSKGKGFIGAACLSLALAASAYVLDQPASANVTRVSELKDVNPNVWAYKALKSLVEKYDVFEGYPDGTFRGNKPVTRYEMAQTLYEVLKVIDLSNPIDASDPESASKLAREFDRELAEIRGRIASLEGRVGALEQGGGASYEAPRWTDRIRVTGDISSNLQSSILTGGGHNSGLEGQMGTRARLLVEATAIADDGSKEGILGEGIIHIGVSGGNGYGQASFPTAGGAVDDVLFSSSNSGSISDNNSSFSGRLQDSRMDLFLDQAYYTQLFKFSKKDRYDSCGNLTSAADDSYNNIFLVADVGLQNFGNTFHKSLVRESSIDGFLNQRILFGGTGASNGTTEGLHLGFNILGEGAEEDKYDACGNLESAGVGSCGDPLPSFFQALSVDYAFTALKNIDSRGVFGSGTTSVTTTDIWDNHSHNLALNLLYDLPGELLGTGLFTVGATAVVLDSDTGAQTAASITAQNIQALSNNLSTLNNTEAPGSLGQTFGSDVGLTVFGKVEQFFTKDRTFGWFGDLSWSDPTTANALVNGPFEWIAQTGLILNTTFMPDTWNFNKDQLGLAYSYAIPFDEDDIRDGDVNVLATAASAGTHNSSYSSLPRYIYGGNGIVGNLPDGSGNYSGYRDDRDEQIIEAYYRKYITENISITPDFQVIFNPNGDSGTGLVGTVRAAFKLPNWNDDTGFSQLGYKDWSQRIAKYRAARSTSY